jgi:hypothetical protein
MTDENLELSVTRLIDAPVATALPTSQSTSATPNVSDATHECQASARPECDACGESGFAGAGSVHTARSFILSSF